MKLKEKLQRWKHSLIKNWRIYRRNRLGVIGLIIFAFFVFLAVFADFIAPYDPMQISSWNVGPPFAKPEWIRFLDPKIPPELTFGVLGTDEVGRDILSGVIYGARFSLLVSMVSVIIVIGIGLVIGTLSGYYGGKIDIILMRITDVMLVLPFLPLMMVITAIVGPSMINLILLLGILGWASTARLVRSQVLKEKERSYVEAAKAMGIKDSYIIRHHIFPNVFSLLFANAVSLASRFIMLEAGLSFMGLGDPEHLSWGMMLNNAIRNRAILLGAWWYIVPPGLCITLVTLSLIFIGQAMDEVLNPRLRRRGAP